MGVYDRDYYRADEPRGLFGFDQPVVVNLVLLNVAVYVLQLFGGNEIGGWIEDTFALRVDTIWKPWLWWQVITSGFLHDRHGISHLLFNMIGLWFFGRDVEGIYGRRQFLWFYLTALAASGAGWALVQWALDGGQPPYASSIGASGAVTAVLVLFCLHYPHRTVYLMFFPVPAWLLAAIIVGQDLFAVIRREQGAEVANVAYVAHLAGAVYSYLFFRTHWSFASLWPGNFSWRLFRRRMIGPKLRVHRSDAGQAAEPPLQSRVDEILEKISRSGQDSLTPEERATLENASKLYQQRRR